VLHSACAAGVSGPRKARASGTLPRPQGALQAPPGASCHSVKAHCSAAVTGVSDGLPVCVAVPLALPVSELDGELVAEAVAEREGDRDPLPVGVWVLDADALDVCGDRGKKGFSGASAGRGGR